MQNINQVNISGNLTRDPELRHTANNMPILCLGVAVNDSVKNNATGEWEDRANYIDCNLFGTRAEKVAQYLHKGMKVSIGGRLHFSQWQDRQTGQNRSKVEVSIDQIEFFTPPRTQQGQYQGQQQTAPQAANQQPQQPSDMAYGQMNQAVANAQPVSIYDESIPF